MSEAECSRLERQILKRRDGGPRCAKWQACPDGWFFRRREESWFRRTRVFRRRVLCRDANVTRRGIPGTGRLFRRRRRFPRNLSHAIQRATRRLVCEAERLHRESERHGGNCFGHRSVSKEAPRPRERWRVRGVRLRRGLWTTRVR